MTSFPSPLPPRAWMAALTIAFALPAGAAPESAPSKSAPSASAPSESGDGGALPANPRPPAPLPSLTLSPDGTLVIDNRARLAWPRCVEGMRWDGKTCTGTPELFTYSQAQNRAKQRWQAEGVRWRLPRVPELRHLLNRSASVSLPDVDRLLFPNAPRAWHWTGSASVNAAAVNGYAYGNVTRGGMGESILSVQQGWAVDMSTGQAQGEIGRMTPMALRLVRPAPTAQQPAPAAAP